MSDSDLPGLPGGAAQGRAGGNGAVNLADPHMGTGGGGGGGAQGGGAGGSSSASTMYGGGGGGGSSLGPAGSTFTVGVRQGDGELTLTYDTESCGVPPTPKPCPDKKPKSSGDNGDVSGGAGGAGGRSGTDSDRPGLLGGDTQGRTGGNGGGGGSAGTT
ncbi:hypothetical protein ABZ470_12285 [Streptosporangium sp. NPDC020072]|uniref:hypothetical protein n=1 Tax=Streptosporangium sp. NPDC020072 TaxID=3154788 RepID=UPI00341E8A71